ncbi:MAG: DNA repair protein RecO [Gammaproteobacteria bacterium]|nr:DNA repair protein RecO [Gammaproteobacteria bacterium]
MARASSTGVILHSYSYRETSLVAEVFTLSHGRLSVIAKGAKRPRSAFRGMLRPFWLLDLAWSGRSDLVTLTRADPLGPRFGVEGEGLLCGFYVNELIVRLLHRFDPHEALFQRYVNTLEELAAGQAPREAVLRGFEKHLLRELGYALVLDRDESGQSIRAGEHYRYLADRGAIAVDASAAGSIRGASLLALEQEDWQDPACLQEVKSLMRRMIDVRLEGRPLQSRRLVRQIRQLASG